MGGHWLCIGYKYVSRYLFIILGNFLTLISVNFQPPFKDLTPFSTFLMLFTYHTGNANAIISYFSHCQPHFSHRGSCSITKIWIMHTQSNLYLMKHNTQKSAISIILLPLFDLKFWFGTLKSITINAESLIKLGRFFLFLSVYVRITS